MVASTGGPATSVSVVLKSCIVKLRLGRCLMFTSGLVFGWRRTNEDVAYLQFGSGLKERSSRSVFSV